VKPLPHRLYFLSRLDCRPAQAAESARLLIAERETAVAAARADHEKTVRAMRAEHEHALRAAQQQLDLARGTCCFCRLFSVRAS
jgi:hypothetical protein